METEVLKELDFKKIQDNLWVYIGDLYIITCSSLRHKDVSDMKLFFRESERIFTRSTISNDRDSFVKEFHSLIDRANEHIGEIIAKQIADI